MAYRAPSFYFYHGLREALSVTLDAANLNSKFPLFDSRQGELFAFTTNYDAADVKFIDVERPNTPEADAIDTIIISGHNLFDAQLDVFTSPTVQTMLPGGLFPITTANGVPLFVTLTPVDVLPDSETVRIRFTKGNQAGTNIPEMTEIFLTTKRTMTRGPEPNWDHPWRRQQRRFVNDAGVSSTWLLGAARKSFTLTWRHLAGADRQIFLDMRVQTDDWSEPFWFEPPDDIYPPLLMEVDRDSEWSQDFDSPLDSGTSDAITMPLIEVTG